MTNIIKVENLSKFFGSHQALNQVEFSLDAGSPIALIGPNGAGKTTLFSILCGFILPSEGTVEILSKQPRNPSLFGQLGVLPQDAQLDPNFAVATQLRHYAQLQGMSKVSAKHEVDRVLELVNLRDYANAKPSELSHGMSKRICIAQTFIGSPKVILLDESTAGLDPVNAREIRNLVRENQEDVTFLLSSHDIAELDNLCERILYLEKGQLSSIDRVNANQAITQYLTLALKEKFDDEIAKKIQSLEGVESVELTQTHDILITYQSNETQVDINLLSLCRQEKWQYKHLINGKTLENQLFG